MVAPLGPAGSGLADWYGFGVPETKDRSPVVGIVHRSGLSVAVHRERSGFFGGRGFGSYPLGDTLRATAGWAERFERGDWTADLRIAAGYGDMRRARRASLVDGDSGWAGEVGLEVGVKVSARSTLKAEAVWTSGLRGSLEVQGQDLRLEPRPEALGSVRWEVRF